KLANRYNICVLLVVHARKAPAKDVLDQISGSTGTSGTADTNFVMQRHRGDNVAKLSVAGRDIIDDGDLAILFDEETGRFEITDRIYTPAPDSQVARVLDLVEKSEKPMPTTLIAETLGLNKEVV